jgi:hypothetical protein
MDTTAGFMRYLVIALPFAIVIAYTLRRIYRAYPDTAFAWFASGAEFVSYFGWAFRTLRRRKWILLVPIALLLSTRLLQLPGEVSMRRQYIAAYGNIGDWFLVKDYFLATLGGRIAGMVLEAADAMATGIVGVFGSGIVLVVLFTLIAVFFRNKIADDLEHYAGRKDDGGTAFFRKALGILRTLIIVAGIAFVATALGGVAGAAVVTGFVLLAAVGVAAIIILAVIGGFALSYLKQVWTGGEPEFGVALGESLDMLPSLFGVRLILGLITRPMILVTFPAILYRWWGITEGAGPDLAARFSFVVSQYWRYPPAVISLFTVCAAFPLVIGARTPWQAFIANFRFVGKYLVRYLCVAVTGVAILFGVRLLSVFLVAFANELSYASLALKIIMDCVFLGAIIFVLLAFFKFFMDQRVGLLPAGDNP